MTDRRMLTRLKVVRAMTSAAVQEHSSCTSGTSRSAASLASKETALLTGMKSRQRRGRPAVGGISRHRSSMMIRTKNGQIIRQSVRHDCASTR